MVHLFWNPPKSRHVGTVVEEAVGTGVVGEVVGTGVLEEIVGATLGQ